MNKIEQMKLAAANNDRERRFTPGTVEIRMDDKAEDAVARIVGYGAVFGSRSVNLGGFTEIIQEGAFDGVLMDGDTRGLFNHDRNWVLGRNGNTMTLRVDSTGLEYDIEPPDTQAGRDVTALVKRGDVNQSSFGFSVAEDGDSWAEDETTGAITRTITQVQRLFDVSPVTFPAYPDTQVAVRSLEEFITHAEEEDSKSKSESESKSSSTSSDKNGNIRNDSESAEQAIARERQELKDKDDAAVELIRSQGEQIEALTETIGRLSRALEIAERMNQ